MTPAPEAWWDTEFFDSETEWNFWAENQMLRCYGGLLGYRGLGLLLAAKRFR